MRLEINHKGRQLVDSGKYVTKQSKFEKSVLDFYILFSSLFPMGRILVAITFQQDNFRHS